MVMFTLVMVKSAAEEPMNNLHKLFFKLEAELIKSSTPYFLSSPHYSMADIYGFPHVSRIFYFKNSKLKDLYAALKVEEQHPILAKWYANIRAQPILNDGKAMINPRAFEFWIEDLMELPPGQKPPLSLPVRL